MKELQQQISWLIQEKYNGRLTKTAKKDIERLKKGEPLDYIIGWMEFLDCKIDLAKKPLIPRVETEFWVFEAISELQIANSRPSAISHKPLAILDMFAGSGAIGIAIMRQLEKAKVVFVDSEKNCVQQIRINCKLNKIPNGRYNIVQSDVFGQLPGAYSFEYIFANPPYIPKNQATRNKIQKSVINFEPHKALFGGNDGLFLIGQFLAGAKQFLAKDGKIFMEFDPPQKRSIESLVKKLGYKGWQFHKDQYGKWRWVVIE